MRSPRRSVAALVALFFGCSPEHVGCEPRVVEDVPERPIPEVEVEHEEIPPLPDFGTAEVASHELRFPAPSTHYVEVRSTFPASGDTLELFMPVWTPGSYLVREFARQVESEGATTPDGTRLSMTKVAKNRWRISAEGELPARVVVSYRVYAREASVRTSFVDPEVGILNGASLFLAPVGRTDLPQDVRIVRPSTWARCVTALDELDAGAPERGTEAQNEPTAANEADEATSTGTGTETETGTEAETETETETGTGTGTETETETETGTGTGTEAEAETGTETGTETETETESETDTEAETTVADATPDGTLRFGARDFDELLDSPIVCGDVDVREITVSDVPHFVATVGGASAWDHERAARDIERIVATQHAFWGVVPYPRYVFFNVLLGGGGGLEHARSTMMMGNRWDGRDADAYRGWLGLASHELFHTWNVKRLRPEVLGPFDYEHEVYLRELWIVEGVTSYYDDLLVHRAGLSTRTEYLAALSKQIQRLQDSPGRELQSLADASFDTWIKFYRPDEHARSSRVSYYTKGAIVAFLLDAELRSRGHSLDEVMRIAYERFGESGYTRESFRALVSEVAEADLSELFAHAVDGTGELDFSPALAHYGLRFRPVTPQEDAPAWIGADVANEAGRLLVREVPRGTPAYEAGLQVEDELLAIDDERLPTSLDERLARLRAGAEVELLVARRGSIRRIELTLAARPGDAWQLELDPSANAGQRRALDTWLTSP